MKNTQEYNSEELYIDKLTHSFGYGAGIKVILKDQLLETHRNYTLEFTYDPTPWQAKIEGANADFESRRNQWKKGLFTGEWDEKQETADLKVRLEKYKKTIEAETKQYQAFSIEAVLCELKYKVKTTQMDMSLDITCANILWEKKEVIKHYKINLIGSAKGS